MKVAIIAPEFLPALGGAGTYAVSLVKELARLNSLEIHVITPKRGNTKIPAGFGRVKIHYLSEAKDTFFYNFSFQIEVARKFPLLHKEHKFDLVHSTGLVHMPDIFLDYNKLGVPHVVTVHTTLDTQFDYGFSPNEFIFSSSPIELLSKAAYPYIKLMQESYIKKTSHFICVSGYVSSFIPKSKSRYVIHNGVDEIEFIPGKNSDFKSLDKIKKPKILFCGRLLYMKGVDSLISSANEIGDKAHFIFAGSGNIKRLSSRLKNKDNVTFIGGVDHAKIHLLYQKCDIFVLPSFSESFPISLLEAMSSGLPVIATEVGGIPEMIIDSKIGCLIKARDQDALEDSILRLISSKAQRTRLGKAARELVLSRFTQSEMASKTAGIYEKIVSDEIMRKKNG